MDTIKRNLLKTVLSVMVVGTVGITGCASNASNTYSQQGIIRDNSIGIDLISTDNSQINPSDIDYLDASYTKDENIYSVNDTVSMNGISYQIVSFEKTKQFGDRNSDTLADYLGDMVDKDNNFIGNESYVFITMTITNDTEETVEAYRCPGNVVGIDDNMEVIQLGECIYMDEYWYGGDASNVYAYSLKPGESVTSEFADIVNDNDIIGRTLCYEIKHSDNMADTGNIFVRLEE